MTQKTIKQLADELGVNKDKVKYQVRKLPSDLTTKINGVTYLGDSAIKIIKTNIKRSSLGTVPSELNRELPTDYLLEQLVKKDEELTEKNNQIARMMDSNEKLQKLLDQQQILTLQANKKIEELEMKKEEEEEKVSEQPMEKEPEKKSLFARWFGK